MDVDSVIHNILFRTSSQHWRSTSTWSSLNQPTRKCVIKKTQFFCFGTSIFSFSAATCKAFAVRFALPSSNARTVPAWPFSTATSLGAWNRADGRIQREPKKDVRKRKRNIWNNKKHHGTKIFPYFGRKLKKKPVERSFLREQDGLSLQLNDFGATKMPNAWDSPAKWQGASLSFADDVWILSLSEDTSHTRLMPHFTCREQVLTLNMTD